LGSGLELGYMEKPKWVHSEYEQGISVSNAWFLKVIYMKW